MDDKKDLRFYIIGDDDETVFINLAYVVKVIVRLAHHLPPSPYPVSAPRRHPACSFLRLSSAARTPS